MKLDSNNPLHKTIIGGLLAALVTLLTMVLAIPIPGMAGAYVNLGDAAVYLCAFLMGAPWCALSAAIGSALADILLGSMLYAGPTFVIKGLMAFTAALLLKRFDTKRYLALLLAGIIMPFGYFLFETALYGANAALAGVPANIAQYIVGIALALPLMRVCEKILPDIRA